MNINDFQNLSRDEQFAEAGRIAGVEPKVFDGIWRTESGRGANMLSPAGAQGHFGLMPNTRAVWEQRFGTAIDPHDFGQSLYTAAATLKENMGRFKNVPDALRAYNGGWDPKKWGNPETSAYAAKVLGSDDAPAPDMAEAGADAVPQYLPNATQPAHDLWDTPAQAPVAKAGKSGSSMDRVEKIVGTLASIPPSQPGAPTYKVDQAVSTQAVDDAARKQAIKDSTTGDDVLRAASINGLIGQAAVRLFRDDEPIDPNFTAPEDVMKGKTVAQQKDLRAAGSQKELDRLLFEQSDEAAQNDVMNAHGALFGIGASLLADLPATAFVGVGAETVFHGFGVGAVQLAKQGRKLAALASLTGENVAGNLAYTAALDAMGQHQGLDQYAMAAAGGLLAPILGGRAIGSLADKASDVRAALRIAAEAQGKKADLAARAVKNLGEGAEPSAIAAEMKRLESEGVRADIASGRGTVPESRRFNVGEDAPEAQAPATEGEPVVAKPEAVATMPLEADAATPAGWGAVEGDGPKAPLTDAASVRAAVGDRAAIDWHDPEVNAGRASEMETNPQWQAAWKQAADGMSWEETQAAKAGHIVTPQMEAAMAADPMIARAVRTAQQVASEYLPNTRIVWGTLDHPTAGAAVLSIGRTHAISLKLSRGENAVNDLIHEVGHAVYHQYASKASPRTLAMVEKDWLDFVNDVRSGKDSWDKRFAATNDFDPRKTSEGRFIPDANNWYALSRDEMMAEQFVTHVQARIERGDYGQLSNGAATTIMDSLKKVLAYFKDMMGRGLLQSGGAETFFSEVLRTSRMKNLKDQAKAIARKAQPVMADASDLVEHSQASANAAVAPEVEAYMAHPIARKYGLDLLPFETPAERSTAKQILNLYTRADAWAEANPVNEKRLNTILKRFDSLDPTSNKMLRSDNPVVRMVASELLENGGGAAGRRSSAAIAKWMNERAIIGNVINELDTSFRAWHKKQPGASMTQEWLNGRNRVQFNRLVAEEIEQRRYTTAQTDYGDEVRSAADSVEASFERARLMQVDAKTVGWASLPETSRGYMPHRMRSDVVRSMTLAQKRALHGALTDQFIGISGFDMSFADQLASKYLDRVQRRALGGFDAPVGLHQTGAADVVREALEAMNLSRPELDAAMKRYVQGGAGHTKKRLNLDLRQTFTNDDGSQFSLMDLFDTDMLSLVRGQSQRVSGEAALARHGVAGKPGLSVLRDAMTYGGPGHQATKEQAEAFDQVAAEFLGSPFGTQNKWVDRAMTANSVMSLGGMGFNQLGELINVGATLGVKSALSNVASFARLRAEIKAKALGEVVHNPLLDSLEKMGGAEFGTDAYKMVFPMDLQDAPIHTMGQDTLHFSDRLLRGAGHVQSKLSGWRTINSVQQRGVAEQVVHAIFTGLKKGENNYTLRDIGISDDVMNRLRADLPSIATFDGDRLTGVDITKATDVDAANQLVQSVHRGVGQMIQGTFIGETGKYVHNSYLKLLTQFRSFNITSIDKQWNRHAGNMGVAKALAMTVGAMSAAAPLYMVRTYLASIGRKDQQEYLDKQLSPGAIARATTNYIATAGFAGDLLDAFTAVTGTGEVTGGRSGTNQQLVGNLVAPLAGKVDKLWGAVQNTKDGTDVHGLIRELPLARLPWFIPAINALGN